MQRGDAATRRLRPRRVLRALLGLGSSRGLHAKPEAGSWTNRPNRNPTHKTGHTPRTRLGTSDAEGYKRMRDRQCSTTAILDPSQTQEIRQKGARLYKPFPKRRRHITLPSTAIPHLSCLPPEVFRPGRGAFRPKRLGSLWRARFRPPLQAAPGLPARKAGSRRGSRHVLLSALRDSRPRNCFSVPALLWIVPARL